MTLLASHLNGGLGDVGWSSFLGLRVFVSDGCIGNSIGSFVASPFSRCRHRQFTFDSRRERTEKGGLGVGLKTMQIDGAGKIII